MNAKSQRGSALRATLWTFTVIVVVGLIVTAYEVLGPRPTGFAGGKHLPLADYREADPTGVPGELKASSLLQRGEYLTRAADCAVCHTAKNGTPFAGGRAFVLPFGTLYSTNITPDAETGIGHYTDGNFLDAVHRGIGPGNVKLYPAMPYPSYGYMSDADALAIKAYLFSLKPLHAPAHANALLFPFNQRWLMGIWSAMFSADQRFEPVADRGAVWNRGAYLVEALGHCGECHTPRNLFFALNNREKFAGAVQAGWRAYNITPDHAGGIGTWSDTELAAYLSEGHAGGRGTATGPMGEAIDESLSRLTPGDIAAMVTYLRSVPVSASSDLPEPITNPAPPLQASEAYDHGDARGKQVYEGSCAGCHGWTGISPVLPLATLTGTRSINDPLGTNVAQVIIAGGQRHYSLDPNNMPAFGSTYSDAEIANVTNYVTARFGARGSALTAKRVEKLRAAD
jgi:mono/diheme cytochrome c family protein